jgi:hypothetical protein
MRDHFFFRSFCSISLQNVMADKPPPRTFLRTWEFQPLMKEDSTRHCTSTRYNNTTCTSITSDVLQGTVLQYVQYQ